MLLMLLLQLRKSILMLQLGMDTEAHLKAQQAQ